MRAIVVALLLAPLVAGAQAQENLLTPLFNLVSLSASAERDVPNDLIVATLAAESEGSDPAKLADGVNRSMQRALGTAVAVKAVRAQTAGYQTFPVYDKGRIARWRVRQELRLESSDFGATTDLVGKLQSDLVVVGLVQTVSGDARRKAENALIGEAFAAFEERARVVRDAMKAKGYRVKELQLSPGGVPPRPMAMQARAYSSESAAAPAIEPGSTRILITVSGTVQMQ